MKQRLVHAVAILAAVLTVLSVQHVARPEQAEASTTGALGVYRGSGQFTEVAAYEQWLGAPVPWVLDFLPYNNWAGIDDPSWWINRWNAKGRKVVYSAPMIPTGTAYSLEAGARGEYNAHWRKFAETFVRLGAPDAVIRLGWEMNGRFYPWKAGGKEDAYAAYWRQIVNTMRSVPGQRFAFDWTFLIGAQNADVPRTYPGDAYVDYIGMAAYDQSAARSDLTPERLWEWARTRYLGLEWHREFARARGKQVSFPEWGLSVVPGKTVAHEDNPHYIEQMANWFRTSNLAYAVYFERDASDYHHRLMGPLFPKGSAAFRRVFANGLPTGTPESLPAPTTTTTTTAAPKPPGTVGSKEIRVSRYASRTPSFSVHNSQASRNIFVFMPSTAGITKVEWRIDDLLIWGAPRFVDTAAPWDLAGGTAAAANPFNTWSLKNGLHTVTASVHRSDGTVSHHHATWKVAN